MSDALIGMLIGFGATMLTVIVPVIANWRKNKLESERLDRDLDKIDMETIMTLKKQVNELVVEVAQLQRENREKERRITKLENRLWVAVQYIRTHDPNTPILEQLMDTDELLKKRQAGK